MSVTTTSDLIAVAIASLQQCQDLLEASITSDAMLAHESRHLPGSTPGKHLRHITDHYRLLLDGLAGGVIDYDSRSDAQHRDVEMETSRAAAQQRLAQIRQRLMDEADHTSADRPLELQATTPRRVSMQTTFGRELWFASLHLIHHASLIRVRPMSSHS